MFNGNDLKRTRAQFTYPKCMIMCSMKRRNEKEGGKKQEKEDEKRKSTSIFLIAK